MSRRHTFNRDIVLQTIEDYYARHSNYLCICIKLSVYNMHDLTSSEDTTRVMKEAAELRRFFEAVFEINGDSHHTFWQKAVILDGVEPDSVQMRSIREMALAFFLTFVSEYNQGRKELATLAPQHE